MPKFSLTINSDDPKEIHSIIAFMTSGANLPALIATTAASMMQNNDHADDGDNAPPNPNAPQFDTAGISWDERIHSKTKALTNDGTWRKKRGVTAADVTAVEVELKARAAQQAGMYMQQPGGSPSGHTQAGPTPPIHPQFNPNMPGGPQSQPQQQHPGTLYQYPQIPYPPQPQFQQPYQPQMPGPQGQQQPGNNPGLQIPQSFDAFMSHLSNKMVQLNGSATPIDANYLATVCQRLSAMFQRPINSITDVGNDPNVIAAAVTFITNDGRWL